MSVTVVDYGRGGNILSLVSALHAVGASVFVSNDPDQIRGAERLILPGVGAFGAAMCALRTLELDSALIDAVRIGTPLLGICVGCQVLLDVGEEFGEHSGLSLIPGRVRSLPLGRLDNVTPVRVPHVGWRCLEVFSYDPIVGWCGSDDMVYFVHSFAPHPINPDDAIAHVLINGVHIPVALRRGSVVGLQFHPEKSGPTGLSILSRFLSWEPDP